MVNLRAALLQPVLTTLQEAVEARPANVVSLTEAEHSLLKQVLAQRLASLGVANEARPKEWGKIRSLVRILDLCRTQLSQPGSQCSIEFTWEDAAVVRESLAQASGVIPANDHRSEFSRTLLLLQKKLAKARSARKDPFASLRRLLTGRKEATM